MKVTSLSIPDVLLIEPCVFEDARGFFFESFREDVFKKITSLNVSFVQDNHSKSSQGVLRGSIKSTSGMFKGVTFTLK